MLQASSWRVLSARAALERLGLASNEQCPLLTPGRRCLSSTCPSAAGEPAARSTAAAPADTTGQRLLTVGLVGHPNAGKSQLTNALVGCHVSGVSPKPHTTVEPHLGAFTGGGGGGAQVVLYDTPGIVDRPQGSQLPVVTSAWLTAAGCGALLMVVDADKAFRLQTTTTAVFELAQRLAAGPPRHLARSSDSWRCPPTALVLNKIDLMRQHAPGPGVADTALAALERRLRSLHTFAAAFRTCALTGDGVPSLREWLLNRATPGAWLLPAGRATDKDVGRLAVELVREQLYRRLHKSLPYRLEPQLVGVQLGGGDDYGGSTNWQPSSSSLSSSSSSLPAGAGPVTIIDLVIHVGSPQVRAIVLGPGGRLLNQEVVGTVQRELQEILMAPLPSPPSSSPNGRRSAPGGAAAAAARRPRVVLRVGVQVVDFRPEG